MQFSILQVIVGERDRGGEMSSFCQWRKVKKHVQFAFVVVFYHFLDIYASNVSHKVASEKSPLPVSVAII